MTDNMVVAVLGTSTLTAIVTWFFTRRKTDAETSLIHAQEDTEHFNFLQKNIQLLREDVTAKQTQLNVQSKECHDKLNKQSKDFLELQTRLNEIEKQYNVLLKKYEKKGVRVKMLEYALAQYEPDHAYLKDDIMETSENHMTAEELARQLKR